MHITTYYKLEEAIENNNIGNVIMYITSCGFTDVLYSASHRHYKACWYLLNHILAKSGNNNYNKDLAEKLAKMMEEQYYDHTIKEVDWMQQCIFSIEKYIINSLFAKNMIRLFKLRQKRCKRIIYEASIKVLCNPYHPVGFRCIKKEYELLFNHPPQGFPHPLQANPLPLQEVLPPLHTLLQFVTHPLPPAHQ